MEWGKGSVAEWAEAGRVSETARALLDPALAPGVWLDRLLARALHGDALRLLAHGLPPRRAVWWSCLCVRRACPMLPPEQETALRAAARWSADPTEARRHDAERAQGRQPLETAAGCLAWAVTVTGSHAPFPGFPPVPADPYLTPRGVRGAIMHALGSLSDKTAALAPREWTALGVQVLQGRYLWDARPLG